MIQVLQLPLGPMQTNCYLLACEQTSKAAVIDPSWNGKAIAATANERGWEITHILLTHAHFDHIGGLAELSQEVSAPIYVHSDAVDMMLRANAAAAAFGMQIQEPPPPDEMLSENQIIQVGEIELQVLYTPGHAPGHVSFYVSDHHLIFDGDVLFQQSIGRADLPGGNMEKLMQTIKEKLMVLPDETQVLPGHGPATTIGRERSWNPFLQG